MKSSRSRARASRAPLGLEISPTRTSGPRDRKRCSRRVVLPAPMSPVIRVIGECVIAPESRGRLLPVLLAGALKRFPHWRGLRVVSVRQGAVREYNMDRVVADVESGQLLENVA